MSKFLDPLSTTEISDSIFEISDHPFRYESDLAKRMFTVPVGFFTDFASVPRLGIVYAMLGDRAHQPAVVHDWLYYAAITTREMADDVLMEAMTALALPWWQRYPIWWGVRAGGWAAWNTHRKVGDPTNGKFADTPDILSRKAA
jgi:uncharacterized membrane protein